MAPPSKQFKEMSNFIVEDEKMPITLEHEEAK